MENSMITMKDMRFLCRVCLTLSKNVAHLASTIEIEILNEKKSWPILSLLETVTFKRVIMSDNFPSNICQICLSYLKISYEFQMQFQHSQDIISNNMDITPIESIMNKVTIEELQTVEEKSEVELIYGGNKFDLKDVVVIDEDKSETNNFEGFLNNLGTEISATFKDINKKPKMIKCENELILTRNLPEELKLIIEEVNEMNVNDENCPNFMKTLFECKRCKILLETSTQLQDHLPICYSSLKEKNSRFICDKCGHISHSMSASYHHLQKHKGKPFKCDQCHKRYDTSSRLKVHMEVHKNLRPFLCNVCGKNFNYAISLKYHLRLHSDEKKYVCNFCGLKYRMAYTLKRHLRTHTKEKPYECEICHKKFSSAGERKCHEMLHKDIRPYRCKYCDKGYTKSSALQTHYLTHSGQHECYFCHKTFIEMEYLRMHMKGVHKIANTNQ